MTIIGSSIGLGTSIGFDALYLTYLREFEISDMEANTLDILNHLIWISVSVVAIGLIGTAIATPAIIHESFFQASAFILGFIALNDSIYTLYLANKMSDLTFADKDENDYEAEKQTSFMMASFSTVSWTALVTIQIITPGISVFNILGLFMALLGVIGLLSLSMDAFMEKRAAGNLPDWSPIH
jgi:hypothetical protein